MGIQKAVPIKEIEEIETNPQAFIDKFYEKKPKTRINELGLEVERVPQVDFWYIDNDEFIGRVGIRHYLTEELMQLGGHIGYGVRPSQQGKGHASKILELSLEFCRNKLNLDKVLLTVADDNIPSIKVIEKNGGILENTVFRPYEGTLGRRYWITL